MAYSSIAPENLRPGLAANTQIVTLGQNHEDIYQQTAALLAAHTYQQSSETSATAVTHARWMVRANEDEVRVRTYVRAKANTGGVTGRIRIDHTGMYAFALTSDDGSALAINGTTVVENDGLHGSKTITGVAALEAGWHTITVDWFNKTGGAELALRMGPVGSEAESVDAGQFSHE